MAQIVSHNPASVHAPSSGYSIGLELGQHRRLLFVSGQVPEESDGSVPVSRRAMHPETPGPYHRFL